MLMRLFLLPGVLVLGTAGCGGTKAESPDRVERIPAPGADRVAVYDRTFPEFLERHEVLTAGVGVIKNGELVWAGYYGEQSPGVPASENTQFDVASITKTITAETILRLADKGLLSLDEPMASYWMDDDIAGDPRAQAITARMALSHSTGFPNWRFLDESAGGRFNPSIPLRFLFDPGTAYQYSGEGLEYVARYAESKLDIGFEDLVIREVFEPGEMVGVSLSRREANFPNIVQAIDAEGNFNGHYCRPGGGMCREEGEWSAADDMRITIRDHAKFLVSVMNGEGYSGAMVADRNEVQTEKTATPGSILVMCEQLADSDCPIVQGYGLGWEVADYGDHQLLGHGGSDFSEVAVAYFYTDTKEGVLIFLNAPNDRAHRMMPEAIELVHPGSPITPHYAYWAEQMADAAR